MSDWETLPEEPKIVEVVDEEVTSENDEDADLEELNLPDIIPEFDENNMDPENMSWPPRPSMPFMADTYDKMKAFILDPDQMEYIFPPMEGETRKLTHTVAELFGLKTKSYGRKNNRHVRVYKYEEIPQTIHNHTKDTIAAGNFNARAKEVKIPMYYKESPVALREEILAETHLGEKLVKRVIREGSGETPDYGHQVYVHYEGYYGDGGVFDSTRHREQEFMFILGEGHVISGWDIAVTSMKPGELIELLTPPEFGFGELGCPPRIPRNATLKYEIELFRFSLPLSQAAKSNAIPLSLAQSIECSNSSRCEGNALVSSNSLRKATKCYNRGLDYFTRLKDLTESDEAKVNECKLPLYSNLALCYIKLKDYKKAQRNCEMALAIDKNHMKALCRMGEALLAEKEVDKAYDYLMRAFEQNKKEPKVRQLLKQIQQIRTEEREMQQNMFKGVFS